MTEKLDLRGMKCPQPVIETKKALDAMATGVLDVIVDNDVARDNILRFAKFKKFSSSSRTDKPGEHTITITKGDVPPKPAQEECPRETPKQERETVADAKGERVILITTARIGDDNDALGRELMHSFMDVLTQATRLPDKMLFINAGVTLTTEGSSVLDALQEVAEKGVKILSCGRCLEYLHLKDKLRVGQVTNMYETIETLTNAASVIKL
ncbi:MAG: sulfurtransferase-like selenium metabolism protein YedF [Planctomycetota bacterium]